MSLVNLCVSSYPNLIVAVYLAGLIIISASLIGVIFSTQLFAKLISKHLNLLVSVAAGIFTYLTYHLAVESTALIGIRLSLVTIIVSFAAALVGFKLVPFFHHHHASEDHHHNQAETSKILLADSIHNITDGVLLAVSFSISPGFGWITAGSILLHEFVQEISEYVVLRHSGESHRTALMKNFITSTTIFIGIALAALLITYGLAGYALALSAGIFLAVITQDLIPDAIRRSSHKIKVLPYITAFIGGLAIMAVIGSITTHHHDDPDHHDDVQSLAD